MRRLIILISALLFTGCHKYVAETSFWPLTEKQRALFPELYYHLDTLRVTRYGQHNYSVKLFASKVDTYLIENSYSDPENVSSYLAETLEKKFTSLDGNIELDFKVTSASNTDNAPAYPEGGGIIALFQDKIKTAYVGETLSVNRVKMTDSDQPLQSYHWQGEDKVVIWYNLKNGISKIYDSYNSDTLIFEP